MDWIIHVLYNTQSNQKHSFTLVFRERVTPKAKRKSLPNNGLGVFRHDKKLESFESSAS